jgi:hypothetical protein
MDSPLKDESNDPTNTSREAQKSRAERNRNYGQNSYSVWRRKEMSVIATRGNRPPAQVGEESSQEPAARLTDLNKNQICTASTHSMAEPPSEDTPQPVDPRKVLVKIPTALFDNLRSKCDTTASVSLLGRIHGKHPGFKALTAWARETLHSSLELLSIKANNIFEVTFEKPEGRIHALNQADLVCESATISFSSWLPYFDANTPQDTDKLDYPVWMQVANLCKVLRDETFLQTVGEQIGQVISIDSSEAYRAKLFGPRIRLLVKDLDTLPHTVIIPRLDGKGTTEHALEFSGLPNQCGRCRSRAHPVRYCPKKETASRQRSSQRHTNQRTRTAASHTIATPSRTPPLSPTRIPKAEEQRPSSTPHLQVTQEVGETSGRPTTPKVAEETATPITAQIQEQTKTTEEVMEIIIPEVPQPDEINFPKLPSSGSKADSGGKRRLSPESTETPHFVWRTKPILSDNQDQPKGEEKGKGKLTQKAPDSTPITRQGYRSGRLADDFWIALNTPHTPTSLRKTIRVVPILTKGGQDETIEYLANTKASTPKSIAQVHIAELLAGVPWTETRVRQHVVSEVAQALYKVLVFPKPSDNPLQKWKQGKWFASWEGELEGDHTCTLFVTVPVQESKIKPRRGHTYGWSRLPSELRDRIQSHSSEDIEAIIEDRTHWYKTILPEPPISNHTSEMAAATQNRFAILSEEPIPPPQSE